MRDREIIDVKNINLEEELNFFREWSSKYSENEKYYGWELGYDYWDVLIRAFSNYIDRYKPADATEHDIDNLLFAIARDNEGETLQRELVRSKEWSDFLIEKATSYPDIHARWQMAKLIARLPLGEVRTNELLTMYFHDKEEYVSRVALLAAGGCKSKLVESFAEEAWNTDLSYRKIAVLDALRDAESSILENYLRSAAADPDDFLSNYAKHFDYNAKRFAAPDKFVEHLLSSTNKDI